MYILNKNKIDYDLKYNIENDNELWIGIFNNGETPNKYIMINTEPLNVEYWENMLNNVIKNALFIIDYSYGNENVYKNFNISNYFILPIGYCELHEKIYNNILSYVDKDIDILFYGAITERRKNILTDITKFSNENNINFIIRNNDLYDYNEKSKILSRSKIVITIASRDPEILKTNDMFRLSFLLSNKIFFITEKIGDNIIENDIFGDYIDYYTTVDELKNKIIYYLNNPEERDNKANKLYEFSKNNYNIENNFPIDKIKTFIL
jgi:glycosyltransferase involved in cell wall biosynthesis